MSDDKVEKIIDNKVVLPQYKRIEATKIADKQADVTSDGGKRSDIWKPFLVDPDEHLTENPYSR